MFDGGEDFGAVIGYFDVGPDLEDLALRRDEIGDAGGVFDGADAFDGDAVLVDNFVAGVGEEFESEVFLGAEAFVGLGGVEGDAEDGGVEGVVFGLVALEVMGFEGAAAGFVFRVKVEDDEFAFVVAKGDLFVFLRGEGEGGSAGAFGEEAFGGGGDGAACGQEAAGEGKGEEEGDTEALGHGLWGS